MAHWSDTLAVFDTETTGLDTRSSRIVTAFVGLIDAQGNTVEAASWLANPGVPIPQQASDVHGITDEIATRDGRPAHEVVGRDWHDSRWLSFPRDTGRGVQREL